MKTYINTKEVAEMIGVSVSTVRNYARAGNFVPVHRLSTKKAVYLRDDVLVWMRLKLTSAQQIA